MAFEVRTDVFEGPFDLLLHLILQEQVDLWDVSLSTIVDAYLTELERMDHLDLDVATEFLLIAATLVELKARRLLPAPESTELDEELMRFEERDLLLARLLECKTFKDVASILGALMREARRVVARRVGPEEPFASMLPDPLERATPELLRRAAIRALTLPAPVVVNTDHIAPIRASVRDAIETVLALLPEDRPVTFREITVGVDRRLEFVVRFLAVLELFKQGVVDLEQAQSFSTLVIRRLDPGDMLDALSIADWDDDEHTDAEITVGSEPAVGVDA